MTTEQFSPAMERFFAELEKTPRTWVVDAIGYIHDASGNTPRKVVSAFRDLHPNEQDVIECAEFSLFPFEAIRARLLQCCGLSEVTHG